MKIFINAAQLGKLAQLQSTLTNDPTLIDKLDESHSTALNWAIYCRHFSCAEYLVKQGADPHIKDKHNTGYTPFDWSITNIQDIKPSQALKKKLLTLLLSSSKTDRKKLSNRVTNHSIYQDILREEKRAQAAAAQAQAAAARDKKIRTSIVFENLLTTTSKQLLSASSTITVDFRPNRSGYRLTLSDIADHSSCWNIIQRITALFPDSLEEYHYDQKITQLNLLFPPEIKRNTQTRKTRFFSVIEQLEKPGITEAALIETEKPDDNTNRILRTYLETCGVDNLDILLLHHYNGTLGLSTKDSTNTIDITFHNLDSHNIASAIINKLPEGTKHKSSNSIRIELDKKEFDNKWTKAQLAKTQQVMSLTKTGVLTKSFLKLEGFYQDFMRGLQGGRPKLRKAATAQTPHYARKGYTIHSDTVRMNKTNSLLSIPNITRKSFFEGAKFKKEDFTRHQSVGVGHKYAYVYLWPQSLPLVAYTRDTTLIRRITTYCSDKPSFARSMETDDGRLAQQLREKHLREKTLFQSLAEALADGANTKQPRLLEVLTHLPLSAEGINIMAINQTPTAILQSFIMQASMENQSKRDIGLLELGLKTTHIGANAYQTGTPKQHPIIDYVAVAQEINKAENSALYALTLLLHTVKALGLTITNTTLYSLSIDTDFLNSIQENSGKIPQQEICHLFLIQKRHATFLQPNTITHTTYPAQIFIAMLNANHPEFAANTPLFTQQLESSLQETEDTSKTQDLQTENLLLLMLEKHEDTFSNQHLERLSKCASIKLKEKSIGALLSREDTESTAIINRFIDNKLLTIKEQYFPSPAITRISVRELLKKRAGTSTSLYPEDVLSLRTENEKTLTPKNVFYFFNNMTESGATCLQQYKADSTDEAEISHFHRLTEQLLTLRSEHLAKLSHCDGFRAFFSVPNLLGSKQCYKLLKIISEDAEGIFNEDFSEKLLKTQENIKGAPKNIRQEPESFFKLLTKLTSKQIKEKPLIDYEKVKALNITILQSATMLKKLLHNSITSTEPSFTSVYQLINFTENTKGGIDVFSAIKKILDEHPDKKTVAFTLISELTMLKTSARLFNPISMTTLIASHQPSQDQFFSFFNKENRLPAKCIEKLAGDRRCTTNKDLAQLFTTEASKRPYNRELIQTLAEALKKITTADGSITLKTIEELSTKLKNPHPEDPIPADCQTLLKSLLANHLSACFLDDTTTTVALSGNLATNIKKPELQGKTNINLAVSLLSNEALTEIFKAHSDFARLALTADLASEEIRALAVMHIDSSEPAEAAAEQEGNLSQTKLAIHRNFFSKEQPDLQPLRKQLHALSHTQFLTATIYLSTIGQGLVSHRFRRRKLAFLFIQAYIAVRSKGAAHYHSGRNTQSKGSKLEAAKEIVDAVSRNGNTLFRGAKNKANRWGTVGYLTDILSREDKGPQV